MIFIYLPNFVLLFIWLYYFKLNMFFSIILTPISYLAINGGLIYYKSFEFTHNLLDRTIIMPYTENHLKNITLFVFRLLNKISYVNKFYTWLKVKILVYLFNVIASYISNSKSDVMSNKKGSELSEEYKNDYLEILNRNRRRRSGSSPPTMITQ